LDERERKVAEREMLLTHNSNYSFVCRQTLRKITEDTIGIGLTVVRNDSNYISKIELVAEYLSATAFFDLQVTSAERRKKKKEEKKFNHFLFINKLL
jgi:hypothetical protein